MLKRKNRLPASVNLSTGKTITSNIVVLKVKANNLEYSRFGFIISKKVAKSAVERNRTKRLIRSCVESVFDQLKPGYDSLFIIRRNLNELKQQEINAEISALLTKSSLI